MQDTDKKKRRQDDDEELDLMIEAPALMPLDTALNVFDRDYEKRFSGINIRSSVFDRQAVFRTGSPRQD
jgi:hypothetical protein